jgi:hypothetical protein
VSGGDAAKGLTCSWIGRRYASQQATNSIPFLQLWTGKRIWRGIVYAILMTIGKLLAGLPAM